LTDMYPVLQAALKAGDGGRLSLPKKMEDVLGRLFSPLRAQGATLMLQMLRVLPVNRVNVDDALRHPFFSHYRHPLADNIDPAPISPQVFLFLSAISFCVL
jgi:hypothetical protein